MAANLHALDALRCAARRARWNGAPDTAARRTGAAEAQSRRGTKLSLSPLLSGVVALAYAPLVHAASPMATPPSAAPQDEREEAERPRGFAIPLTREAGDLAQRALAHIEARRDSEALQVLQTLIEQHAGEVIRDPAASSSSAAGVFVGAGDWARRQLEGLSPTVRAAYLARHRAEAERELTRALAARDAGLLAQLARRFPATPAAEFAWRALGDVEAERGDLAAAQQAWTRAAELEAAASASAAESANGAPAKPSPSQLRRSQFEALLSAGAAVRAPATAPGADAATWVAPLSPEIGGGPFARGDSYSLHACVNADQLFVSDTLRVWAFDAWSGERRWVSAEPAEWRGVDRGEVQPGGERALRRDDFFEHVDRGQIAVRPAANGGVVVAALQTPFSHVGNRNYQQFRITSVMPERRLAAFDARTGAPLWDHFPPPLWDGESGPFETRMSVGAAPVVAGSRVLVGAHRMRGRVDFHVACFELHTGALLWSSPLVSGQVELNMFGRPQREYTSAPVLVDGSRVFVATQMGALAALDLFTGDVLWESLYEQVPIPRAEHWRTEMRRQFFASSAPALAAGTLIVAPADGRALLALDPASGETLWTRNHEFFTRDSQVVTLLEATDEALWLSTDRVLVARAPRGLRTGPTTLDFSAEVFDTLPRPRASVGANGITVPGGSRRITLDRQRLLEERRTSAEWAAGQLAGNAQLADGAAYFVSDSRVSAAIDWRAVSERFARECAAAPDDPRPHLGWSAIVARRGLAELNDGDPSAAARLLAESATLLERWLESGEPSVRAQARERFVAVALDCAEAHTRGAALRAALEWTERALARAEQGPSAASALLRKGELLAALKDTTGRVAVLEQLEQRHGGESMPRDWFEREDARRYSEVAAPADQRALSVAAFVALERALLTRAARDAAAEFAQLHALLEHFGDLRLPVDPQRPTAGSSTVSARIGALLAEGQRDAYEPYERAAQQWLERASASNDLEQFELLARRFPHSRAAALAERSRREAALSGGDLREVLSSCLRATPHDWDLASASDEQLHAQWVLRAAMSDAGNHEFAEGLLRRLERDHGERVSPLARDGGRTLAQLREESGRRHTTPAAPARRLAPSTTPMRPSSGSFLLLGETAVADAEGGQVWAQILCRRDRNVDIVSAWSERSDERPLWAVQTPQGAAFPGWRAQFASGVLILGNRSSLTALEDHSGQTRWRWSSSGARIDSFHVRSGVALVATSSSDGSALLALDARSGLELWTRATRAESWSRPVLGEHHVVVLPSDFAQTPADVLDLYTGARLGGIQLLAHVGLNDVEGAWIEQERLILPSFPKSSAPAEQDCVSAYDLRSGRRLWRVVADAQHEFDSILRAEGHTYLILLPRSDEPRSTGMVQDLDLKIGAVGRISGASWGPHDVLVGIGRRRVVESDHPYLFVRSATTDGEATRLRAFHLPFGERWSVQLDVSPSQLNAAGAMPMPLVADESIAIAYSHAPRNKAQRAPVNTDLILVERESGVVRERSALPAELGPADKLDFALLGDVLWISGPNQMLVRR